MPAPKSPKPPLFVGVDVGGTNIKIGLLNEQGQTLAFRSILTEPQRDPTEASQRIGQCVDALCVEAGIEKSDVAHLGLATPGPMDIPKGILLQTGNLPGWWNFPIRDSVSQHCGLPVRFANDANAAAYGEYWRGAGAKFHSMVMLTLGTGVGGGIIVEDQLIEGAYSCGAECGHMLIDSGRNARVDSLGIVGSLEAYCGAYAIVARTTEAIDSGRKSGLAEVAQSGELTPLDLAQAAESGDELAREIVLETARYLSLGIVTLIHTIDPDSVVLGGAVTFGGAGHPLGEEFLQRVRDETRPRLIASLRETLNIEFATLGSDAGYVGAAGLARLAHGVAS